MVERETLRETLDAWLVPGQFRDYCPNGLQLEGKKRIERLATAVTASQAVIDQAVAWGADALLVHHGWFWKNEAPALTGIKYRRIRALMQAEINLLAYHLPLDCHPKLGNNACLAQRLGLAVETQVEAGGTEGLLWVGHTTAPIELQDWAVHIGQVLQRPPLVIAGHARPVQRVAWCTGAAQGFIDQAADLGVDAYLSGEVSEPTYHTARERGIHYVAAGHHATERYGVQAVGEKLAREFGVAHRFIDEPNPV